MLELVCAQAPYNMRGLFGGCMALAFFHPILFIEHHINNYHNFYEIKAAFSLFGFILYSLLARWYKRRVRDEDYNAQRVVEEVYDRYLSAQH